MAYRGEPMNAPRWEHLGENVSDLLSSVRFAQSMAVATIGTVFLSFTVRHVIGWAGLVAILGTLVVLAGAALVVRRGDLEWRGLLPISLLVFVGWSAVSVFWSYYGPATVGSSLYQLAVAFLAIFIAVTRDLIQIVRAFGDVLRVVLAASLLLEVLSGILLDLPVPFLDIQGDLAVGGPIQGLLGSRNQLGLVALIALITFYIELQTRSVARRLGTVSLVGAALVIVLTRSPVTFGAFVAVAVATVVLLFLRGRDPSARRLLQFALVIAVGVGSVILFAARSRVIDLLNAGSEFEYRYDLWRSILVFTPINPLEGFGWLGYWRGDLPPYFAIGSHASALNALLDVVLQLGVVGMFCFVTLLGLTIVRSWLIASNKRSVVYLWPALCMVALVVTSAAESSVLVEFGWLTLVLCTLKASQNLSWRSRLADR